MASFVISFLEIEKMLIAAVGEISGVDMYGREYKGIEDLWNVELNSTERPPLDVDDHESDDEDDEDGTHDTKVISTAVNSKLKAITTKSSKNISTENLIPDQGKRWYNTAYDFWEDAKNCPVTDDGVLGGYGRITPEDVKGSNSFLDQLALIRPSLCFDRAADCGAGIGRVTKHLLLHRFKYVDIIEQSPRLLAAAPSYIGEMSYRANCIVLKLQVDAYHIIFRKLSFLLKILKSLNTETDSSCNYQYC